MAVTIARTAWIDDDGTGTTGTVINNAVKTELYNQIDGALAQLAQGGGSWINQPYSAGMFTANAGAFTVDAGDLRAYAYSVTGKTVTVNIALITVSISGGPNELRIALPAGITVATWTETTGSFFDTAPEILSIRAPAGATYLSIFRNLLASLAYANTTSAYLSFSITFGMS